MPNHTESPGTQQNQGLPATPDVVTLSKEEFDKLSHRAQVSNQNYVRLQEALTEKAELEAQLGNNLAPSSVDTNKLSELESEIEKIRSRQIKEDVLRDYPQLADKWNDLEAFRQEPDNKGMNLRTAAKAFLIEKGLLDPVRKGLEPQTGGPTTPIVTGYTTEQVKELRENNPRKYREELKKGNIRLS